MLDRAAERLWYWTAGVLEGTANGWSAYVQDGYVTCERWNLYDQRWDEIRRPLTDFEREGDVRVIHVEDHG